MRTEPRTLFAILLAASSFVLNGCASSPTNAAGAGAWAAVIGDVCGKGTRAAALTGLARHTLRAAALGGEAPSGVLSLLNEAILREQSGRNEREALTLEAVKLAAELGVDVNAASTDGRTALDAARVLKFDSVVKFLEGKGAKPGTIKKAQTAPAEKD